MKKKELKKICKKILDIEKTLQCEYSDENLKKAEQEILNILSSSKILDEDNIMDILFQIDEMIYPLLTK